MLDPHKVLGVPWNADPRHIRAAYRKRAADLHPDRNPRPDAAERLKEVVDAYRFLSDPGREFGGAGPAAAPTSAAAAMDPAEFRRQQHFRYLLEKLLMPRVCPFWPQHGARSVLAIALGAVLLVLFLVTPNSILADVRETAAMQNFLGAAIAGAAVIVFSVMLIATPGPFAEIPFYSPRRGLEPSLPYWLVETYGWLMLLGLAGLAVLDQIA